MESIIHTILNSIANDISVLAEIENWKSLDGESIALLCCMLIPALPIVATIMEDIVLPWFENIKGR